MAKSYPRQQMFLSCMAFSVYEVVRVACLSSHANDFVNAKNLSSLLFIVPYNQQGNQVRICNEKLR